MVVARQCGDGFLDSSLLSPICADRDTGKILSTLGVVFNKILGPAIAEFLGQPRSGRINLWGPIWGGPGNTIRY